MLSSLKTFLLLSLLLFSHTVTAQTEDIEVKLLRRTDTYNFPRVTSVDPVVAEKINTALQTGFLSQVPDYYFYGDPYHIVKNGGDCGQTIYQDFSFCFPSASVLEIRLDVEHSYCSGMMLDWQRTFVYFDTHLGEKIELSDLFSRAGYRRFKSLTIGQMQQMLQQHIRDVDRTIRSPDLNSDALSYRQEQKEFYTSCLDYTDTTEMNTYQYRITSDSLIVTRDRCYWNETTRGLDEYSVPRAAFAFEALSSMLSPYGQGIFITHQHEINNPSLKNKVFTGLIAGQYPITAIVQEVGGQAEILYWYDKTHQPLRWAGSQKDGTFHLTETVYYVEGNTPNPDIATVALTFSKDKDKWKASGQWTNIKIGKVLSIELDEQ